MTEAEDYPDSGAQRFLPEVKGSWHHHTDRDGRRVAQTALCGKGRGSPMTQEAVSTVEPRINSQPTCDTNLNVTRTSIVKFCSRISYLRSFLWVRTSLLLSRKIGDIVHSGPLPSGNCDKVMFSHLSVILFTDIPQQTPPRQTPPQADMPLGRHPQADTPLGRPPGRHPPPETVIAADGTHPTGMHSCIYHSFGKLLVFYNYTIIDNGKN